MQSQANIAALEANQFRSTDNPAKRPRHISTVASILATQRSMHERAVDPETPAKDASACARAEVLCVQMLRAIRMKPTPKPVDVPAPGSRRAKLRAAPAEIGEPAPAPACGVSVPLTKPL